MSEVIFLDTNFFIDFVKGQISRENSEKLLTNKKVKISSLVEYELRLGQKIAKSATYKITVEKFLEHSIIVPVSEIIQKTSKIQAE